MADKPVHIVFRVLNWLYSDKSKGCDLLPNDERILINLAHHHGPRGICPTLGTVSRELNISERYLRTRLTYLASINLIKIQNSPGMKSSFELLFLNKTPDPQIQGNENSNSSTPDPQILTDERITPDLEVRTSGVCALPTPDPQITHPGSPDPDTPDLQIQNIEIINQISTNNQLRDIAQNAFAHDQNAHLIAHDDSQQCANENAQTEVRKCANRKNAQIRFEDFWKAYPRKKDKQRACKIWQRKKLDEKADFIISHLHDRKERDEQWQDEKYIPHPSTFLHNERWTDEFKERKYEASNPNNVSNGFQRRKSRGEETWDYMFDRIRELGAEDIGHAESDLSSEVPKLIPDH